MRPLPGITKLILCNSRRSGGCNSAFVAIAFAAAPNRTGQVARPFEVEIAWRDVARFDDGAELRRIPDHADEAAERRRFPGILTFDARMGVSGCSGPEGTWLKVWTAAGAAASVLLGCRCR